jgi:thiamine biosynthesis lipoprotein
VAEVFLRLRQVDRLFSTYRPDSDVSRFRRGELTERQCHPLVREVMGLCERARERTDGCFYAWLPCGFDPSGLVKGWAVERAAGALDRIDACDYYLNAGGDMVVKVASPDSPAWKVGIENPRNRDRIIGVRTVRDGGIATSGSAARGAHIIDPRTGARPAELFSVTVIGPHLLWADVYATAAFVYGTGAENWLRRKAPRYQVFAVGQGP